MPLDPQDAARVAAILGEHPEWTTGAVRAAAGLKPTQLFAVKAVRSRLGVPEPGGASGGASKRRGRKGKNQAPDHETLGAPSEDVPSPEDPSGPERSKAGAWRPQSLLAPILPRVATALRQGLGRASSNMTRGVAPMTLAEATAIAVPTVRIIDRTVAKYVKRAGKVTPNQEDAALIALTIIVWGIGWIVASMTGQPRGTPPPNPTGETNEQYMARRAAEVYPPLDDDEAMPSAPAVVAAPPAEEGDLFAGSGPVGPGSAGATPTARLNGSGPADAVRVSDDYWALVSPTDYGTAAM